MIGQKDFVELPVHIKRIHMRLLCYPYSIIHIPVNVLYTSDILTRAPYAEPTQSDHIFVSETTIYYMYL